MSVAAPRVGHKYLENSPMLYDNGRRPVAYSGSSLPISDFDARNVQLVRQIRLRTVDVNPILGFG